MTKKSFQITCKCLAYKFPHRLNGGKCTGDTWCEWYQLYDGSMCRTCSVKSQGQCDVISGRESLTQCSAYEYHMDTQQVINLPIDLLAKYNPSSDDNNL